MIIQHIMVIRLFEVMSVHIVVVYLISCAADCHCVGRLAVSRSCGLRGDVVCTDFGASLSV